MHRSVGAAVETPDREGRGTVAMDAFGQACDAVDRNEIDVGNINAEAAREQHRSIFILGDVRKARCRQFDDPVASGAGHRNGEAAEIGRATGRERVGQYWSVSVDAGSSNKKKDQTPPI